MLRPIVVSALAVLTASCWALYNSDPPPILPPPERDAGIDTADTAPACEAAPIAPRDAAATGIGCTVDKVFTATATIDRDGGDLKLEGTNPHGVAFAIHVPPRALVDPIEITVSEINEVPSRAATLISPVYIIEPIGITFLKPVEVMLPMPKKFSGSFGPGIISAYIARDGVSSFAEMKDAHFNAGFFNVEVMTTGVLFSSATTCDVGILCR